MVETITVIYLFYIFISLYVLSLYIMIYISHRKDFFSYPQPKREYSLDMIVPCYNEGKTIEKTINALLNSDYKGLKKIIVVDDNSTDNSFEIIKNLAKNNPKIIAVRTPKNTGKASGSKNYGVKFATSELIGFSDGDSFPDEESISQMVGFFNESKVGAVTSSVLVSNDNNLLERFQAIEYRVIVFTRKLLGFVDGIYVTPGPLAIYKRSIFNEIGGFDENNLTEDIEITWNLVSRNYSIKMSPAAKVYTEVPSNIKSWLKQRQRWNIGGVQTIKKYRKSFLKKGMLGSFILPFFVISWIVGISGLLILFYRLIQSIIVNILTAKYSIQNQAALLNLRNINLVPDVLFFFGALILLVSLIFTIVALKYTTDDKKFKKIGLLSFLGYTFVYLIAYPINIIISVYKVIFKRKYSW